MLKDLNWHPLDQRLIDSRLVMLYKVTYDLNAVPASQYLTIILDYQDTCIHFHTDRFPLLKNITGSHFPKDNYSLECPASPHTSPSHLGAVQQHCLPGEPCLSLNTSIFFHLLNILTHFSHLQTHFTRLFYAFISLTPFRLGLLNPSYIPLRG